MPNVTVRGQLALKVCHGPTAKDMQRMNDAKLLVQCCREPLPAGGTCVQRIDKKPLFLLLVEQQCLHLDVVFSLIVRINARMVTTGNNSN